MLLQSSVLVQDDAVAGGVVVCVHDPPERRHGGAGADVTGGGQADGSGVACAVVRGWLFGTLDCFLLNADVESVESAVTGSGRIGFSPDTGAPLGYVDNGSRSNSQCSVSLMYSITTLANGDLRASVPITFYAPPKNYHLYMRPGPWLARSTPEC